MRLVRYSVDGSLPTWGSVSGGYVQDIASAGMLSRHPEFEKAERELLSAISNLRPTPLANAEPPTEAGTRSSYPLESVQLHPPLLPEAVIFAVGRNYSGHAAEGNLTAPKHPKLFVKLTRTAVGDRQSVILRRAGSRVDYEAELGVVIGRHAFEVAPSQAMEYLAGYTVANDVSDREIQFEDEQLFLAKNFDTFCPIGPWIITGQDAPADPAAIEVGLRLNGTLMQNGSTKSLIFSIPELISFVSFVCPLRPGDVILTGTPAGVGCFREPPVYLKDGDRLETFATGVGTLTNVVEDGRDRVNAI